MNQNTLEKKQTLRFKTPIIILSIVSLLITIFALSTDFYNLTIDDEGFIEVTWDFPDNWYLIFVLIRIAPWILLVIYLLQFHNSAKATILVPIIFGLIAFFPIWFRILLICEGAPIKSMLRYGYYYSSNVIDILFIVAFALAVFSALKGFSKRVFIIIACIVGLLAGILIIDSIINYYISEISWYAQIGRTPAFNFYWRLIIRFARILGEITLYIALLLFGSKNSIPAILSVSPKKEKMTPEQELKLLNEKLELGLITDEEYHTQRADIISKL